MRRIKQSRARRLAARKAVTPRRRPGRKTKNRIEASSPHRPLNSRGRRDKPDSKHRSSRSRRFHSRSKILLPLPGDKLDRHLLVQTQRNSLGTLRDVVVTILRTVNIGKIPFRGDLHPAKITHRLGPATTSRDLPLERRGGVERISFLLLLPAPPDRRCELVRRLEAVLRSAILEGTAGWKSVAQR